MTRPVNPYAKAYKSFLEQTRDHKIVLLHDEGLYRHLRIQEPGTRMWSWDITTWPGHLATSGDVADGYMFTRELDMIDFFNHAGKSEDYYSDGAPCIDVRYWAEKLCGGRSREVKVYEPDLFLLLVREHLEENEHFGIDAQEQHVEQRKLLDELHKKRGLTKAQSQELLDAHWAAEEALAFTTLSPSSPTHQRYREDARDSQRRLWENQGLSEKQVENLEAKFDWLELGDMPVLRTSPEESRAEILADAQEHAGSDSEAHKWLMDNDDPIGGDTYEWDLTEYDFHFLLTCYCIDLAVRLHHQHQAAANQPETGQ